MPQRLFVISDMQFNSADHNGTWSKNHDVIKKKYSKSGYKVPQIIYWNVKANTPDFPVQADETGTALVSGYSQSILKVLLEDGELDASKVKGGPDTDDTSASTTEQAEKPQIDPYTVFRKAIDDPRYDLIEK